MNRPSAGLSLPPSSPGRGFVAASAAEALFIADTPVEGVETITKAVGSGEHQPQRPTVTGNSSPASFIPHRLPIDAAAAKVGYGRFGGPGGE
jgi:hypothetical protein